MMEKTLINWLANHERGLTTRLRGRRVVCDQQGEEKGILN
jgi:hypothetical protein